MDIAPIEIPKKEFGRSLRGYNKEEVDDFLEEITRNYEKIYKENRELKEQVANLEERIQSYKDLESTLRNTLVMAERTAEDVKKTAQKERDTILKESLVKAQGVLNKAEEKYNYINNQVDELRRQFYLYKIRFRTFVEAQLDFLETCKLDIDDENQTDFYTFSEVAAGKDTKEDVVDEEPQKYSEEYGESAVEEEDEGEASATEDKINETEETEDSYI